MRNMLHAVFLGGGYRRADGGRGGGRGNVAAAVVSCWAMSLRVGSLVAAGGRGRNVKRRRKRRDDDGRGRLEKKKEEEEKQLIELMNWVTDQIDQARRVPRLSDVVEQAGKGFGFRELSRRVISAALRRHPYYHLSSHQVKGPRRLGRHRPIVCNQLGVLHADIAFYSKRREFETPKTFQSGFLIAKDVLSRFVYFVILRGNRTAKEMERAFRVLLQQHEEAFGADGHKIVSISFDKEPSVLSHRVQSFFRDNFISFHGFEMSDSKSKMAENVIRLLRTTLARLMEAKPPSERKWWRHIGEGVASLNSLPIVIDGQRFSRWTPADVNKRTLSSFLRVLHRKVPVFYFAQFEIAPQLVNFKYSVGSVVRPKLLATSSALIGVKRSEENLKKDRFRIEELVPYVARNYSVGRAYRCVNLRTRQAEVFDEWDLALSH